MNNTIKMFSISTILGLGLLLTGCDSRKAAKEELEQRGITYNVDSFSEAISSNNNEVIELFLKAGIDSSSPKILAPIINSDNVALFEKMLDAGLNPNSKIDGSPLIVALAEKTEMLKVLLKAKNVYVNAQEDKYGYTALMIAMTKGLTENVKLLVEAGADDQIRDKLGENAWGAFIYSEYYMNHDNTQKTKLFEMLKAYGKRLNPNSKVYVLNCKECEMTVFHIAIGDENEETVQYLIDKKANLNAKFTEGHTQHDALSLAAMDHGTGNIDIVKLLVKAGASTKNARENLINKGSKNIQILKILGATQAEITKAFANFHEEEAVAPVDEEPVAPVTEEPGY